MGARDVPLEPDLPTTAEIAALTARLRELQRAGAAADAAERARFLADKDALIARIIAGPAMTTPSRELGLTGAEGPPIDAGPALTAEDAAHELAADGRSLDEARALVRGYLDDVSEQIGASAHLWGLDAADLEAIRAGEAARTAEAVEAAHDVVAAHTRRRSRTPRRSADEQTDVAVRRRGRAMTSDNEISALVDQSSAPAGGSPTWSALVRQIAADLAESPPRTLAAGRWRPGRGPVVAARRRPRAGRRRPRRPARLDPPVYLRYPDAALPACWLWHPRRRRGAVVAAHAHADAYHPTTGSWQRVGDWHDRHRPGVAKRVLAAVGTCELALHRDGPPALPAAARRARLGPRHRLGHRPARAPTGTDRHRNSITPTPTPASTSDAPERKPASTPHDALTNCHKRSLPERTNKRSTTRHTEASGSDGDLRFALAGSLDDRLQDQLMEREPC